MGAILYMALCPPEIAAAADLDADIRAVLPVATATYHQLHANPELGKQEFKTHDFILARLKEIGGFTFTPSTLLPTVVIATFDTGRPGPVIVLRSEMDARRLDPGVVEPADHQPRSQIDGLMHNCGHDAHAAILLATARLVASHPEHFVGKIIFLFQPAEETPGGADDIVNEGLLDRLGVQKIFALHSSPGMPVGTISIVPGAVLAGSSYFDLTISGRGSHAAAPYQGDDLPLLSTYFAQAIEQLPARRLDLVNRPTVISITKLKAESGALNILPEKAELAGTIRAFENPFVAPAGETSLNELVQRTVDGLAAANGVKASWMLHPGSPPTRNDEALFNEITPKLKQAWPGMVDTTPRRGMFSEDFAFYTSVRPCLYFSLGIAKDGLGEAGVHTANFTIHPDSLATGVRLLTLLARIATTGEANWP